MVDSEGEVAGLRSLLEKTRMQLHIELEHKKEIILENSHLRQDIKKMDKIKDDSRDHAEKSRKINLLEEQVQYLERRLEGCRQDSALTLSSIEGQLGNENGKLKAREKDLRRKLHREKEKSTSLSDHIKTLTTELRRTSEEMKMKQVNHTGWMKHVRLPAKGEWQAIKLDTDQNKKALRHVFQQVEKEGGPPCNLDPAILLHCVVLFLWWKREATFKAMEEDEKGKQKHPENEEKGNQNVILQERIKTLEAALDDSRAAKSTLESTMSTNLNQLLKDKYDLDNKVSRLEDTVSALHLDNNLLRGVLNDRSAGKQTNSQLDEQTAELKAQFLTSESELKQTELHKEQLKIDLGRASKRLQVLEQEARIRDTVCKEHTERLEMCDVRRVELEKMTSEFTATIWSLENDIKNLEESRGTTEKEREAFLSQLSKALGQLEDTKEQVQEYQRELRRKADEQAQYTKTLQEQDQLIGNLRRDLTNQKEAKTRLKEEKEKRRSLEVISTNHEKLVIELQERMRVEEVDSATMLAEFCEGHAHERMRLERRIDILEAEREDIGDVVETLSNDKATLRAENQRLKSDFQRATLKLHDTLKRQALRVFPRTRQSTDASTSTDPAMRRSSPIGGEGEDGMSYGKIKELEEFIDLLVSVKGTVFSRYLLGVDGEAVSLQDVNDLDRCVDVDELRGGEWDDEVEELMDGESRSEHHRSVKSNTKEDVFANFRALALMMKARQKLRSVKPTTENAKQTGQKPGINRGHRRVQTGKDGTTRASKDVTLRDLGDMLREAEKAGHGADSQYTESNHDSTEIVDEPLVTRQEQRPLYAPGNPSVADETQQPRRDKSGTKLLKPLRQSNGNQRPSPPPTDVPFQESDTDSDSEDDDLMSTLEREQQQLRSVLKTIKDEEALVEEELKREQEAHMVSLKKVTEYQEQCVMMQLEKETLLQEPQDGVSDDGEDDSRRSTLDVELEKMLLEELDSLKEENRMLVAEKLKQKKFREGHGGGLAPNWSASEMKTPLLLSPQEPRTTSPQRELLASRSPVRSPINPKFKSRDSKPQRAGTWPEFESPIHQTLVNMDTASIQTSLDSLGFSHSQTQEQIPHKDENSFFLNVKPGDVGLTKAERDNFNAEAEGQEETYQRRSPSVNADKRRGERHEALANSTFIHHTPEQRNQRLAKAANVLEGGVHFQEEAHQHSESKKHLEKQNHVTEEVQLDRGRLLTSTVPRGNSAIGGLAGKKYRKTKTGENKGNGEAEAKSTDSDGVTFSSLQREDNDKQPAFIQNGGIGMDTPIPRGLELNEKALRARRILYHTPASSQNDDLDNAHLVSTSNYLGDTYTLQPTMPSLEQELAQARAESNTVHAEGLEMELLKCQTDLLGSHRDRQDLLDQLTMALQTEVRLQNMVDKLQTKVGYLQTNLDKSAEFVESLKEDKEYLHNNYTAAVEERQSLQVDIQDAVRSNKMLEQELVTCKKHSEFLEQELDLLNQRSESKTRSGGRKVPREIGSEEFVFESQSGMHGVVVGSPGSSNYGGDKVGHDEPREVGRKQSSNQRHEVALSRDELKLLHHETAQLRDQLTEARQAEDVLQLEIKKLQEEANTLHSCLKDNIDFVGQVQKERDSMRHSLVAAKEEQQTRQKDRRELEADLEAAHQRQQQTLHQIKKIETENKRLRTKQALTIDKLHKDIETLKRQKLDLQNRLSLNTETTESPFEERTSRKASERLRSQINEQKDNIFELESQLDESRILVGEIGRERDILQDDVTEALQTRTQLKTQLGKSQHECHSLEDKLQESQARVKSLREELEEYLQQDYHQRDNETRLVKKKLRELDLDHQTLLEERDDKKLRIENLEIICKMHNEKYLKEHNEKIKLETELEMLRQKEARRHVVFEEEVPEARHEGYRGGERGSWRGGLDNQEATLKASFHQGLKTANEDIQTCFDRLGNLEDTVGNSVTSLQEELNTQMKNISRMRESAEVTLQRAVTKTKQLTEENHKEILTMIEKAVALRVKNSEVTAGQRLVEARELLERSITEQRKQAASIVMLRQSMEKALLQHGALRIRLRQQSDKSARAFSYWNKERLSLKKQLQEANKSLKHIESYVTSAINQSQGSSSPGVTKDELLQQQIIQTRELKKMVRNCLCQKEVARTEHKQREEMTTLQLQVRMDEAKQHKTYEETLKELRKKNMQLSLDLHLANESLEMKKQECWRFGDALQDAEMRERDVTGTLKEVKDQLKIEVEMQSQLAMRSEKQEEEIFKLRKAMGKEATKEQETPTQLNKEKKTNEPRMNDMLSEFSREIKSHLEDHMEKTQLNNETDDRKKIQELDSNRSSMEAQHCIDKITIQALTDDNRRLRTMVYKLRERITNNQMSNHKDSRMDGVYQALARAQVRVIARSMADGSQSVLTGAASMFTDNIPKTQFTAGRLVDRRHMGSVGNSLGDSFD
ncbi:rootletin-like [Asterias rubens]|uniref:rootletin-like n=1 Tax=Asterias rubens TaxID=7604 RepID=UPI0014553735|nr:rootletin-like [Asterias rubens]